MGLARRLPYPDTKKRQKPIAPHLVLKAKGLMNFDFFTAQLQGESKRASTPCQRLSKSFFAVLFQ
jgi:hypothetical protein